jgi:carbamoyl-phosphate synthase large subunit
MNILLTCAGRRNFLVEFFQAALAGRGRVIACDSSASAPALAAADRAFVVPPGGHADYFEVLAAICAQEDVRLLISVYDLELPTLAQLAPRFRAQGTTVVVSSPQVIATCQDKWASYQFLRACDIPTPATFRSLDDARQALARKQIRFPLLIKPRWGTTSIGVERVDSERELALAQEWLRIKLQNTLLARLVKAGADDMFIVQEFVEGDEYGMDIVNRLDGRHAGALVRRKLAMRAGNTDRAVTVHDPALERVGRLIGERLGHVGSLDCDLIVARNGCRVIDLNPRFGGGYPFSHVAGANVPAALIAWANDEEADPAWLRCRPGVLSAKYDSVTIIDPTYPLLSPGPRLALCESERTPFIQLVEGGTP